LRPASPQALIDHPRLPPGSRIITMLGSMRIVQISDTHVSARGGVPRDNLEKVVEHVNRLRPDLVVHSGDLVALDPDLEADRATVRELLSGLRMPWRVIPGNHDVGDVGERPWMGIGVTASRIAAYRESWGPDQWVETVDGWAVVGFDSQLLGSGLQEEHHQWERIAGVAAGAHPVLLFSHVPPFPPEAGLPEGAVLENDHRDRLLDLFELGDGRLRGIGAGHLHLYRQERRGGAVMVWGPATAMILRPGLPAGIVVWDLHREALEARFEPVPGLEERELRDIPVLVEQLAELEARTGAAGA
jgi:3',5'-cyclic AMP phosphodiesterase CpdA